MSRYANVQAAPPIEVFHINKAYNEDSFADKVNLSIGAYRTDDAKPWVLPVVREVELRLANDATQNHEYLTPLGFEPFCSEAVKLLFGADHSVVTSGKAIGVQCLSGTGSLRVAAETLVKILNYSTFYVSSPSWENHHLVFKHAGVSETKTYRYWDQANRKLDFDGLIADLEAAPENAVVVLHACAHNPTGIDPTRDQWKIIGDVLEKKRLFPLLDVAYQGFASGDPDQDAWAARYLAGRGLELMVAQSFAKNFGLYNERIGNLVIIVNDTSRIAPLRSQITLLVRANWSNPPNHGARIVHAVLSDPALKQQWFGHIHEMAERIIQMRKLLREHLEKLGTPGTWNHITDQIGMFSYTGLNEKQVATLIEKHHCYLLKSGRISMCGLTTKNVEYFAKAVHDVVVNVKD